MDGKTSIRNRISAFAERIPRYIVLFQNQLGTCFGLLHDDAIIAETTGKEFGGPNTAATGLPASKAGAYDKLFELSQKLLALGDLFEDPETEEQFARVVSMIHYHIDALRHAEFILRERIFRGDRLNGLFDLVDAALHMAESLPESADWQRKEEYNRRVTKSICAASELARKISMQGQAKNRDNGQQRLGGA